MDSRLFFIVVFVHHSKAASWGDRRKNPYPLATGPQLVQYV